MAEIEKANPLQNLRSLLTSRGSNIDVAVAFVSRAGLRLIEDHLAKVATSKNRHIRFLLGVDSAGVTEPDALAHLLSMAEGRDSFELKAFVAKGNETFHPKLFMAHSGRNISFLSGSYNLTKSAIEDNLEFGLFVTCSGTDSVASQTMQAFKSLWEDERAIVVDDELVRSYRNACRNGKPTIDVGGSEETSAWKDFKEALTPRIPPPQWPSSELAYLMGIIHARGKFVPQKSRIQIQLEFKTGGSFELLGQSYANKEHTDRVRGRIAKEFLQLPYSKSFVAAPNRTPGQVAMGTKFSPDLQVKVYPSSKRVVFADFSSNGQTFSNIYKAFDYDAGNENPGAADLPRGSRDLPSELALDILRGYCLAAGTLSDSFNGELRLNVTTKAQWKSHN